MDFWFSIAGRQFIDGTMPRIAKALESIAKRDTFAVTPKNVEVVSVLLKGATDAIAADRLDEATEYIKRLRHD